LFIYHRVSDLSTVLARVVAAGLARVVLARVVAAGLARVVLAAVVLTAAIAASSYLAALARRTAGLAAILARLEDTNGTCYDVVRARKDTSKAAVNAIESTVSYLLNDVLGALDRICRYIDE